MSLNMPHSSHCPSYDHPNKRTYFVKQKQNIRLSRQWRDSLFHPKDQNLRFIRIIHIMPYWRFTETISLRLMGFSRAKGISKFPLLFSYNQL